MLKQWMARREAACRAGIVPAEQTTALAVVQQRKGAQPLLRHCGVYPTAEIKSEHVLAAMIPGSALSRTAVNAVIVPPAYRMVQVEVPDVPAAEVRAAVRWKLRDVIDFPVDEAVVDVFSLPEPSRTAETRMLMAVVAQRGGVQRIIQLLAPRARGFDAIDIPELCLRNIATLLPQDANGVTLITLAENHAQLSVTRRGVLYLTRRVDLARRGDTVEFAPPSSDGAPDIDMLALEIQRSLDYLEAHFDLPPITELVIAPGDQRGRAVATALDSHTNLNAETIDLGRLFDLEDDLEIDQSWHALLAVGAALRAERTG